MINKTNFLENKFEQKKKKESISMTDKNKRERNRILSFGIRKILERDKKAQVTIFIIIAIVIVASIGLFFVFRGNIFQESIPKD
jgi:hypothetical protein